MTWTPCVHFERVQPGEARGFLRPLGYGLLFLPMYAAQIDYKKFKPIMTLQGENDYKLFSPPKYPRSHRIVLDFINKFVVIF